MSETETTSQTETTDSTQTATESFIGDDLTLKEGWQDALLPEDLRSQPIYNQVKDVKGALSIIGNQAKLVGKKGVILPTDLSKPEEWDEFYKVLGRPDTVDDYALPVPEELKDYYDDELVKSAKDVFHKIGLTQKQANALWEFEKNRNAFIDKALKDNAEREKLEAETALRNKWGNAYDENMHIVSRVITENVPGDKIEEFLGKYGNNPMIAEILATVGKKFTEHRIITDIETPSASANKRIDELMGKGLPTAQQMKMPYWDRSHVDHKKTVELVQALMREEANRKTGTTK